MNSIKSSLKIIGTSLSPKFAARTERAAKKGARKAERIARLLGEVAAGKFPRVKKDGTPVVNKKGEQRIVELEAHHIVDRILKAMAAGASPEAVATAVPDLAARFAWQSAREPIYAVAKEREVALSAVARVFGLEAPGDVVVPSMPEAPAAPPVATPKVKGAKRAA